MILSAAQKLTPAPCLCFAVLLSLTPAARAQDSEHRYTVRGEVINSVTHDPVARALVTLAGNGSQSILTDSEGRFNFVGVAAGQEVLQAWRPGYLRGPEFRQINVGPGLSDVMLALEPAGSITGHVTLSNSDPSTDVRVELLRRSIQDGRALWQASNTTIVNSEGNFHFSELQPGEYRIRTANSMDADGPPTETPIRWGFPAEWYPQGESSGSVGVLRIRAGEQAHAEIALSRELFYLVTVQVPNTSPTGAGFQVRDRSGHPVQSPARYDYDPRQQLLSTYLSRGSYTIIGEAYAPSRAFGGVELAVRDAPVHVSGLVLLPIHPIAVTIRKEFTAQEENNGPQGFVGEGQGTGMEMNPGINLVLLSEKEGVSVGANLVHEPGSSDETAWMLDGAQPGRYWVNVQPYQGYAASIQSGGSDLARNPLVVGPGGSSAPIDIVLRNDFATLSAHLKNNGSSTDGNIRAYLYLIPHFETSSSVPEGMPFSKAIDVSKLQPGSYQVIAFDQMIDLEYHNPSAMEGYAGKGQTVTLDPGGTVTVDLDLISAGQSTE